MAVYVGNTQVKEIYVGNVPIKMAYCGSSQVFSSGHNVTYHIDVGDEVQLEINDGADCIANAPTATKTGYTFIGWRQDNTASSSVISALPCDSDGINLYAVFGKAITLSYNGNGNTGGSTASQTGNQLYNNGNTVNPTFTLRSNGYSKTNYTFAQWAMGSASGTRYSAGASVTLSSNTTFYAYWVATVKNFSYTGRVQSFTAQSAGTYKLEVWGGKGGDCQYAGGKGGYAKGNVKLTQGQVIYVVVGGQGTATTSATYNGGGGTGRGDWGSGGGATHIGKQNALLKNTSVANLFIVAGGGGGAVSGIGGTGGGTNGGDGSASGNNSYGRGGTQSGGGYGFPSGSYGQGGTSSSGGGGGGGYYGGGGGTRSEYVGGGGGGSGYVGGCISGTTSMSNGVQSGAGRATITFISAS